MADIMFTVRADLKEEEREHLLHVIEAIPGVTRAAPIKRDSKNEALRRMHFARLDGEAALADCLSAIRDLPEVEQASAPARRGL